MVVCYALYVSDELSEEVAYFLAKYTHHLHSDWDKEMCLRKVEILLRLLVFRILGHGTTSFEVRDECEGAMVSGHEISQTRILPPFHGTIETPSGLLPSDR